MRHDMNAVKLCCSCSNIHTVSSVWCNHPSKFSTLSMYILTSIFWLFFVEKFICHFYQNLLKQTSHGYYRAERMSYWLPVRVFHSGTSKSTATGNQHICIEYTVSRFQEKKAFSVLPPDLNYKHFFGNIESVFHLLGKHCKITWHLFQFSNVNFYFLLMTSLHLLG